MKKILSASIIAAAAMAAPAYAQDTAETGTYVHIRAGLIDTNNPSVNYVNKVAIPKLDIEANTRMKSAVAFSGEAGHDFGVFSLGVEFAYNRNKINSLTLTRANGQAIDEDDFEDVLADLALDEDNLDDFEIDGATLRGPIAKVRQIAILANLTYDIPVEGSVQPYVGAGIGGVYNRLSAFGAKDTEFELAWQVRAGAAFKATENIAITADYTYRVTGKSDYRFNEDDIYRFGRTKASLFQIGLRAGF